MSGTPPGWYPDAQGTTRWFDGTAWTEHTQPAAPVSPPSPYAPDQPSGQTSGQTSGETPAWTPMSQMPPSSPPSAGYPGAAGPQGPAPRRDRGLLVGLGVLSLVLLVGIVVVGVLLLTRGDDATASDPSPVSAPPAPSSTAGSPSATTSSTPPTTPAAPTVPSGTATGGPTAGGDSPRGVTKSFLKALLKGDCDTAETFVDPTALGAKGACDAASLPSSTLDSLKVTVGAAKVDGDRATVPVKLVPDVAGVDGSAYAATLTARLHRVGGEWKLTDIS